MRYLLPLLLVLAGCASQPVKRTVRLPITGREVQLATHAVTQQATAPAPLKKVAILWDHDQQPGDTYEVWHSTNLQTWSLVTNTNVKSYQVPVALPQEFFKVRARNGELVSDWATK